MRENGEIELEYVKILVLDPHDPKVKKWMIYLSYGNRETVLYANYLNKYTHLINSNRTILELFIYEWNSSLALASYYHWQNELTFVDIDIMKITLVPTYTFIRMDKHIENEL